MLSANLIKLRSLLRPIKLKSVKCDSALSCVRGPTLFEGAADDVKRGLNCVELF